MFEAINIPIYTNNNRLFNRNKGKNGNELTKFDIGQKRQK